MRCSSAGAGVGRAGGIPGLFGAVRLLASNRPQEGTDCRWTPRCGHLGPEPQAAGGQLERDPDAGDVEHRGKERKPRDRAERGLKKPVAPRQL